MVVLVVLVGFIECQPLLGYLKLNSGFFSENN